MAAPDNADDGPDVPNTDRFQLRATGEDARNYDFTAARPPAKTTNMIESIGHLVKCCLGGGVVTIHEAYKNCGLWTATVLSVFIGISVSYGMYILTSSAQKMYGRCQIPSMTYPDLAEATFACARWQKIRKYSKSIRYFMDCIVVIDLFGACCVYQVVCARAVKQLVDGTEDVNDSRGIPIRLYILGMIVPSVLLCMITSLKYLAPFSIVADVFILTVAGATVYYGVKSAKQSPLDMPAYKSFPGLLEFIGVCVFSMEGIGVTLAIENSMTKPKKIPLVLAGGMLCVVGICMMVGFFGYWGFGEKSKSPITLNFPWETFPIMLKVFMAVTIYVTFALNFWIPFEIIWFYIKRRHNSDKHWLWQRVYRAIFVVLLTLVAIIFPNVSKFMGLMGSFCLSNMGFIFPAIIELIIDWSDPGLGLLKWRLWKALIIIMFGVFMLILGTYSNLKELIVEEFLTKK